MINFMLNLKSVPQGDKCKAKKDTKLCNIPKSRTNNCNSYLFLRSGDSIK